MECFDVIKTTFHSSGTVPPFLILLSNKVIISNNFWRPLFINCIGVSPRSAALPGFILNIVCFIVLLSISITSQEI